MPKLNDIPLNKGVMFVVAIFAVIVILVGGIGAYGIQNSLHSLKKLNEVNVQQKSKLNITNTNLLELRILIQDGNITGAKQKLADAQSMFKAFLSMNIPDNHRAMVDTVTQRFEAFVTEGLKPQIKALEANDAEAFARLKPQVSALSNGFYTDAVVYFVFTEKEGAKLYTDFLDKTFALLGTIAASILLALAMIFVVLKGIKAAVIRPLEKAVTHCERLADGDLSRFADHDGTNEIGKLFSAMEKMQVGIAKTVGDVRLASAEIFHDSQRISRGNVDLASRTEEQAASLEEIASSMEQLTATVGQNAENSSQASKLAHTTSDMAQRGGTVVDEVVLTMKDISTSSDEVVGIIDVIDGIAFQTNILALNASVEAARAGEQGRGFAVVATEVRSLANRSSDAAKQIRELLHKSAQRIVTGSELVDKAGTNMNEIVASVQRVTTIMNEIASASREQSDGIAQVNQAIAQMDQVTQQNAGMVQEAANAAQALEGGASSLMESVEVFKLSN
jgi:methyl-accepting chemotaxis protein-2 (aspartate sensor receptor)